MGIDLFGTGRGSRSRTGTSILPRNDPRQYDELAAQWWRADGPFAMLHWLAEARARLIPPAGQAGAVLVDIGCGAGLLAPYVAGKGYRHVGVDLVGSALTQAAEHGVAALCGDATGLPLADDCAGVVVAGEVFEHVPDWPLAVAEACRVLRPGGRLVLDTLNATAVSRLLAVRVAERLPGVPRGIHDPRLFIEPRALTAECARHGVRLTVRGIRPAIWPTVRWLAGQLVAVRGPGADRSGSGAGGRDGRAGAEGGVGAGAGGRGGAAGRGGRRIVPTWSTAVLYQGLGVKIH